MAYNEPLANRVRERLAGLNQIEEKPMMGGLTFMYKGKMCVGIIKDNLMCRVDPALVDAIGKTGLPPNGFYRPTYEKLCAGR